MKKNVVKHAWLKSVICCKRSMRNFALTLAILFERLVRRRKEIFFSTIILSACATTFLLNAWFGAIYSAIWLFIFYSMKTAAHVNG